MNRPNKHAIAQRKYRAKKHLAGYQRLDILVPPALWERLEPHLRQYCYTNHPGKALIILLESLDFGDE